MDAVHAHPAALGIAAAENKVRIHDVYTSMLYLIGLDDKEFT